MSGGSSRIHQRRHANIGRTSQIIGQRLPEKSISGRKEMRCPANPLLANLPQRLRDRIAREQCAEQDRRAEYRSRHYAEIGEAVMDQAAEYVLARGHF